MQSWISYNNDCDFTIYNIPFGIATKNDNTFIAVSAIGEFAIDLSYLNDAGFFSKISLPTNIFRNKNLNEFIGLGKAITRQVRTRLQELFSENSSQKEELKLSLISLKDLTMQMPVQVPNYTDFYSSMDHAVNIGTMIRDPKNALSPNWLHIPIGYHGRASSITISGTNFHRPKGQSKAADAELPSFGPSKMLDIELEMAFIVGKETNMGESIPTSKTDEYIFGFVMFNDWSARDLQTWEYVPLGPFLAKNFCSTISPWIVTLEALEPFRVQGVEQQPKPLPYLQYEGKQNIDINLDVYIKPENVEEELVSKSNYRYMYWNMSQQLAHHTCNGCNVQVGDMYASGTISGPNPESYGSMMELTWRGTKPIKMKDGSERKFINDNDTVIFRGYAQKDGVRVGFGECVAKVLPSI